MLCFGVFGNYKMTFAFQGIAWMGEKRMILKIARTLRKQLVPLKLKTHIEVKGLVTCLERKANQAPRLCWEMTREVMQISGGV